MSLNTLSLNQTLDLRIEDFGNEPKNVNSLLGVRKPASESDTQASSPTPPNKKVDDRAIRSWGCDRTETPLIFVHNGKSGGGAIRARLAAAAQNVTRGSWHNAKADEHFYPILDQFKTPAATPYTVDDNKTINIRKGNFCNSQYPHYVSMPHIKAPLAQSTFEGRRVCNATTPLGIAVACHHPYRASQGHQGRAGGIRMRHYVNANCKQCDDDYYLEKDYYFVDYSSRSRSRTVIKETLDSNATLSGRRLGDKRNKSGGRRKKTRRWGRTPKFSESRLDPLQDPPPGSTCDAVFAGHLNIGSELTWLPPRYLKHHWWDKSEFEASNTKLLEPFWERLLDDRKRRRTKLRIAAMDHNKIERTNIEPQKDFETGRWCPEGYKYMNQTLYDRPSTKFELDAAYETCSRPLAEDADRAFREVFSSSTNYSPFYASMPVHRVTMMRDPWSWIISKFFWHQLNTYVPPERRALPCFDVTTPIIIQKKNSTRLGKTDVAPLDPLDPDRELGWVEQFSLLFLIKLCGDDCRIRYENGMMTLQEIEEQVSSNLRNAFSVVGILHEQDSFYDMLTDRIQYVDMGLHPNMTGEKHATPKSRANLACKELFGTNETFRESVRQQVPAFATLERMYHLGIRVNQFQKEELKQCKLAKGEEPTRRTYPKK